MDQLLDTEENPYRLWAEIHALRATLQGPDGYATWKDAAVAERIRRIEAEKSGKQALKVLRELANQDTYNARQDFYAAGGHEAITQLEAVLEQKD